MSNQYKDGEETIKNDSGYKFVEFVFGVKSYGKK